MQKKLRPFFKYYGGKFRDARKYPAPVHSTIVEPFAGAAGYSLRHNAPRVVLCDLDSTIVDLWRYLIAVPKEEILGLPDIPNNSTLDDFDLPPEAKMLIGFWLNAGVTSPCKTPSSWMRSGASPTSYWCKVVREVIASQLHLIRHWEVYQTSFQDAPVDGAATWFIDPPYENQGKYYRHGCKDIDFDVLSKWCRSRSGQIIVCEQEGAKWLPFSPLFRSQTARRTEPSSEVCWINESA